MTPLLILTAILLAVSGAFKLRAAARAELGLHSFSLLELVAAVALMVLTMAASLSAEQGFGAVVAAVVLIVVSSWHLGKSLGRRRRLRGLTEGRRLETYVKYMADIPEDPGPGGMGGIPRHRSG